MFRNPHEGMAKFLGSIGDMRRQWEQDERVRQQDERVAQQHKVQMEEAAQRMALAKSGEERANMDANAKRLLDPLQRRDYETQIIGNEVGTQGKRIANMKTQADYEQYLKDTAPGGWQEISRGLERKRIGADINQSNAAAGASNASRLEREAALAEQQRIADLMKGWGKQGYGEGDLTNEQALMLGIKGMPGRLNSSELRFITQLSSEGTPVEVAVSYLQNPAIREALGLEKAIAGPAAPPANPNAAPSTTMQGKLGKKPGG